MRSILIGFQFKKRNLIFWFNEGIRFLFTLYILLVVSVTFFPLALWFDFNWERIKFGVNVIPFVSIIQNIGQIGKAYDGDALFMIKLIIRNVGGNILLFMPLGVLVPLLSKKYKDFKRTLILGLWMSLCIESIQFFELLAGGIGRAVDIDDVVCNTIGVIVGFYIYIMTITYVEKLQIKAIRKLDI